MAHVFISYAHADANFIKDLKLQLQDAGFDVWIDEDRLKAGENWRQAIDDAIQQSNILIVVISPEAYESKYVTYEWAYASGIGIPIIPILLKTSALHPRLEILQYIDFHEYHSWGKIIGRLHELGQESKSDTTIRVSRDAPVAVKKAIIALDSHNVVEREQAIKTLAQMHNSYAIEGLISALGHPIRDVRILAFELTSITQLKSPTAIPKLSELLKDGDSSIRQKAAHTLGELGDASAVPNLLGSLFDENEEVRKAVERAIIQIGKNGFPYLEEGFQKTQNSDLQAHIITILGVIKNRIASPVLLEALKSDYPDVRKNAALAFEEIKDPIAIEILENTLRDSDKFVRIASARALGAIGSKTSISALIESLADQNDGVRANSAAALGKIGQPSVIPNLLNTLADKHSGVRSRAANALVEFGDHSIDGLLQILRDTSLDFGRSEAAWALGKMKINRAVEDLLIATKSKDSEIVRASIIALGQIADEASVKGLFNIITENQPHSELYNMAMDAFESMKNVALSYMRLMLKDSSPHNQQMSANVLTRIFTPEAVEEVKIWNKEHSSG